LGLAWNPHIVANAAKPFDPPEQIVIRESIDCVNKLAHWQIIIKSQRVEDSRDRSRSQSHSQIALLRSHLFLHDQPVFADISGTDKLRSNWKDPTGAIIPPLGGYVVIRQTFLNLSLRLLTKESSSHLVGTEIVCAVEGLYCVSGVYRNEPRYQDRSHSEIHFGAVWLQVIDTPAPMLEGHYGTDRKTAGEMLLTDRQRTKFQDFKSAQASYARLPAKKP
jgi:hypothetical protein